MKLKRILLSVFMIAALAVVSMVLVDAAAGDADNGAQDLLTAYYNEGVYTKQTVINVKDATNEEVKAYFHAGANALERTTYYNGGELYMTGEGINSGYESLPGGGVSHFYKNGEEKVETYTVSGLYNGRDWTSMESAFVTLYDLKSSTGWEKSGTVYTNTTAEVLDQYREFVAPMWLSGAETANYVVFEKATMENTANGLVLKLYVQSTDASKLVDGANLVFAQALITDHICQYSEAGHDADYHYNQCACGAIDNASKVVHSYIETWEYNVKTSTCSCGYSTTKTYLKFDFWTNDWSNSDGYTIFIYYWDPSGAKWAKCTLEDDNGAFGDRYSVVIDVSPSDYKQFIVVRAKSASWSTKVNQSADLKYADMLATWERDGKVTYYL